MDAEFDRMARNVWAGDAPGRGLQLRQGNCRIKQLADDDNPVPTRPSAEGDRSLSAYALSTGVPLASMARSGTGLRGTQDLVGTVHLARAAGIDERRAKASTLFQYVVQAPGSGGAGAEYEGTAEEVGNLWNQGMDVLAVALRGEAPRTYRLTGMATDNCHAYRRPAATVGRNEKRSGLVLAVDRDGDREGWNERGSRPAGTMTQRASPR